MSDSENDRNPADSDEEEPQKPIEEVEKELEEKLWNAFMVYDIDGEGKMPCEQVGKVFAALDMKYSEDPANPGQHLPESDIYKFICEIDPDNTGFIKYSDFKPRIMERELERVRAKNDVGELLDAYVAMGGDEDGGGCVDADKLIATIKNEFGMTIDIEALIEQIDEDGSGEIEFDEFQALLSGDA